MNVHQTDGYYIPCYASLVLESGSITDGVFRASCLVPADSPNGEYWLEVHVYDTQKNPSEENVDHAFEVVGGVAPDHTPPSISDETYADTTLERGQTLQFTASVSDLASGVNYVNFKAYEPYSQYTLCDGPMHLQSGDKTSGVWAFSCEVPLDCMIASYSGHVYAYDNQNNEGTSSSYFIVEWPE